MDLEPISAWMESTPVHDFMLQAPWAFPTSETLHFMGLTLLIGSLLVVDMRGMGMLRMIPYEQAHKLIVFAIVGFITNVITGFLFLFTDPRLYFVNTGFWFKMLFILLAGINALLFELLVFRKVRAGDMSVTESWIAKITSALSLVFWLTVLILGRFLPFTEV